MHKCVYLPTFAERSKTGVLEVINDDTVKIKESDDAKPNQLWIKGDNDNNGYFTLKSSESQNFLTSDGTGLKMRGK